MCVYSRSVRRYRQNLAHARRRPRACAGAGGGDVLDNVGSPDSPHAMLCHANQNAPSIRNRARRRRARWDTAPWGGRTRKRQHERHLVGDFCVMRAPAEDVAHAQRLARGRHRVVEALQPRLTPTGQQAIFSSGPSSGGGRTRRLARARHRAHRSGPESVRVWPRRPRAERDKSDDPDRHMPTGGPQRENRGPWPAPKNTALDARAAGDDANRAWQRDEGVWACLARRLMGPLRVRVCRNPARTAGLLASHVHPPRGGMRRTRPALMQSTRRRTRRAPTEADAAPAVLGNPAVRARLREQGRETRSTERTLLRPPGMYSWLLWTRACRGTVTSTSRPRAASSHAAGPYRASTMTSPAQRTREHTPARARRNHDGARTVSRRLGVRVPPRRVA